MLHSEQHAAKSILQQHHLLHACVPQPLVPAQWVQEMLGCGTGAAEPGLGQS